MKGDWCYTVQESPRMVVEGPMCICLCVNNRALHQIIPHCDWQVVGFPLLLLAVRHVGTSFAKSWIWRTVVFAVPPTLGDLKGAWNDGNWTSCCLLCGALLAQRAGEPSLGLLTGWSKVAITWVTSYVFYFPMRGIKPTYYTGSLNELGAFLIWCVNWICCSFWAVAVKCCVWCCLQGAPWIF